MSWSMITAKPNKSKRTFTLRRFRNGELVSKYRTTSFTKEEFNDAMYMVTADWEDYLKRNEVIVIK